jgi:hypothetical protein
LSGRIYSISGLVNTHTLNISSISGLVNTHTLNITSLSGQVYNANLNIASISGIVYGHTTSINTINSNITSISGLVYNANLNIASISGIVYGHTTSINSLNTTVGSHTTSINTINSSAAFSAASIIANGYVQATYFKLTNPSNVIYKTEVAGITNVFSSGTTKTIVVSSLPVGLYIMTYSLYILNSHATINASFSSMIFQLASSIGYDYFNENDYHKFIIPKTKSQTFSETCIVNNPATYNFTLSITPTYTGPLTNLFYGNAGGIGPSPHTFLQFTKIG